LEDSRDWNEYSLDPSVVVQSPLPFVRQLSFFCCKGGMAMSATHVLAAPALLSALLVGAPAIEKAGPGFLGVQIRLGLNGNGLEIVKVIEGAAADKAGLKAGDLITQVDGEAVGPLQDFVKMIGGHKAGDKLKVTIFRDGTTEDVKVVLGEAPKEPPKEDPPKDK
jgi:S1-C subfamily serine protease